MLNTSYKKDSNVTRVTNDIQTSVAKIDKNQNLHNETLKGNTLMYFYALEARWSYSCCPCR